MSKYYYCPICGSTVFNATITICPKCQNHIKAHSSIHETKYYQEKSMNMVGNYSYARQILIDEEISQNPLYNPNTTEDNAVNEFNEKINNIFEKKESSKNIPKCPTCGSTDINKISAVSKVAGAATFGLFSKTARSQFKCNNCGYKW